MHAVQQDSHTTRPDLQICSCAKADDLHLAHAYVAQVSSRISADGESAASIASAAPSAEKHGARPRLETELDSDLANASSSHESAGYAESSATESDQDVAEDSDYVAESSFSQDASSYADSEGDYMREEQVMACTTTVACFDAPI